MGSDEEGKCFFLPRQVTCVEDHTELILYKEKAVFRDTVYCFKMYLFWNFTYILLAQLYKSSVFWYMQESLLYRTVAFKS